MIAQANDVIRTMLQLRVEVRNEQLPISALIRRPLFALRYILPDDRVSDALLTCGLMLKYTQDTTRPA